MKTCRDWTEMSPEEKDSGVLVDERLNMTNNVYLQLRKPTVA